MEKEDLSYIPKDYSLELGCLYRLLGDLRGYQSMYAPKDRQYSYKKEEDVLKKAIDIHCAAATPFACESDGGLCPNCSKHVSVYEFYCPRCGKRLDWAKYPLLEKDK